MENQEKKSILKVQTANQWIEEAKLLPIPKAIFGHFWRQGELAVLVADTNQGKTILIVQVIDAITSGKSILEQENLIAPTTAIYYDLELTSKQFELRYAEINEFEEKTSNHFIFSDNFFRGELNYEGVDFDDRDFTNRIIEDIEKQTIEKGAKAIVIDNVSCIMPDNEKAKNTTPFITKLNVLKKKHGWSIIIIAHTPKRIPYTPMTLNDIQGSKAFSNLVDSVFALGESQKGSSIKYLKQLKVRYGAFEYDSKNVLEIQINKESNFTSFSYLGTSNELEHLKQIQEADKSDKIELAFDMKSKGFNNVAIAKELGVAESTIRKWIKKNEKLIAQESELILDLGQNSEKPQNPSSHDSHTTNSANGANDAISKSKEPISKENDNSKEKSSSPFPQSKIENRTENSHESHESYTSHSAKSTSSDIDSKSESKEESKGDSENQNAENDEEKKI